MKRFPQQVLEYEGERYLIYRAGGILALHRLGMLLDRPYLTGAGFSDYVCADSKYDMEERIKAGVSSQRMVLVGDYSLDALWAAYNNRQVVKQGLLARYEMDPAKKIVLVAMPQMAEHGYLPWEEHIEYIEKILKEIPGFDVNVLVSLHPKMKLSEYQYLEEKFPCKILSERLFDVLPAADIFLSKASSTIRWGVVCDIDVILFDFWGFDLLSYEYLDCIDVVRP
ncbi:MAG: hypothetical protein GKR95_20935 [Gammaproteobacteria bacterium]|nr:hypothetical protein [Gammaproteobacteria bacterium]